MSIARIMVGVSVGAVAALSVAVVPAVGAASGPIKLRSNAAGRIGSFTPAGTDARLAAALARNGAAHTTFKFTAASSVRLNRSVAVAVRARTTNPAAASERAALVVAAKPTMAPIAYDLGVAIGWRRFALSGDMAKADIGTLGKREAVDVGVSYTARDWSTRVQVGADRVTGSAPRAITGGPAYSVDLGGSYSIARDLDVTAGVRYRAERDRLTQRADDRRDSQAVYVGTAFRF